MKRIFILIALSSFSLTSYADGKLVKLFKQVDPSVVVIYTEARSGLKGDFGEPIRNKSLGSGVVISENGLIMTAAHVVHVADRVEVEFSTGEKYPAEVLSSAVYADVALIKLQEVPNGLKVATLGDSDQVNIGERVFVIGSPYGIDHSLTVGVLSGRRIDQVIESGMEPVEFLQTDAAINQGNSGGPLFSNKGSVVGIVSHIKTQSGGNEGLGFATSINTAKALLLEEKGVWSGVEMVPIQGPLAKALNVPQPSGILVQRVAKNSMGYFLGLKAGNVPIKLGARQVVIGGDIILAVNGISIKKLPEDLMVIRQALIDLPVGERIDVDVLRGGQMEALFTRKRSYITHE